ncbi:MAG: helix-turn-helix domain-containing protein [Tepidisphaeraceae bacterium]
MGERLIRGLRDLKDALERGEPLASRFTVHTVERIPDPPQFKPARVRSVRARVGASQTVFAQLVGVSPELIRSWEQGFRKPSPLARRLLEQIERDPRPWVRMIRAAG